MGNRVKSEHYVSRCYLKNFVFRPKKGSVYCFDKNGYKTFPVTVENILKEKGFYETTQDEEQILEQAFGCIESMFKPACEKLIMYSDLSTLTPEEKAVIASFVVTQELRTLEHRTTIKDMMGQAKNRLYKQFGMTMPEDFKLKYGIDKWGTENDAKIMHLNTFTEIPTYVEILLKLNWLLVCNRTPLPFWTSDAPVNRYNSIKNELMGNLGLLCKGIEIHFPISPKLLLCCYDGKTLGELEEKTEIADMNVVYFENSLQVVSSTRYLISNKNDFSFATKILKEKPSFRDPNRRRVIVH